VPLSGDLVDLDTQEIKRADADHRQSMRWLAWGMGGIGLMGAGAGLVFGYGVARALSRTIRRLQIRLLDAAGKLSPDLPEIVLTGDGDLGQLEGQMQELMVRIEQLVKKLQQREREVLRAEQMAAVGQLAAGVAHEIRNPLTSIKMLVQAGREEASGLVPEDLEVIEREALRMERSLQVFLDFARLPKPERSRQDLAAIAEQTLNLVRGRAAKQHVELKFSGPDGAVFAEVDGEQIRQVLVNLCLNALDAMPAGGGLELTVKPSNDQVELSVLDSGPGLPAELMPRLFEPFVSTKETGLGLGLVISRRIVEEHHGQLIASNRIAGGATFTVMLPVGQKERG
jgi:signal transduction histidine kinase